MGTRRRVVAGERGARGGQRGGTRPERSRDLVFSELEGPRSTASTKRFRSFDIPNPPWLVLVLLTRCRASPSAALKRRVFALSRSDVAN